MTATAAGPDLDRKGVGAAARQARAAALDAWIAGLLLDVPGVALAAVGGLARRECAPYGDVDLVLLYDDAANRPGDVAELAGSIWYPVWDARIGLDHSVRTAAEALAVAGGDIRVALGLLDARHLAGDPSITTRVRSAVLDLWRRESGRLLAELYASTRARWESAGELAYLLEGDVKEARGGLRDVAVLRAVGTAGVADAFRPPVRAAHTRLLDVRDALHVSAGRRLDRLVAQERQPVAALLGPIPGAVAGTGRDPAGHVVAPITDRDPSGQDRVSRERDPGGQDRVSRERDAGGQDRVSREREPDPDALLRRIAQDARTIAHAMDDAWRAVRRWQAGPQSERGRRPIGRDVVAVDGEAVLARDAIGPRPDPALGLRVAAAAAGHGIPIARGTLQWLATYCPAPPTPWPAGARAALLTLLGSGSALVATWEACDRYGLTTGWIPQWTRLRSMPQHNPVHLYTVDRHLVGAAAEAARYAREVSRPDLLVLAAFLHDVGKGLPGPHSETGAPVAAGIARDIGLPPVDVAVIERLVRLHLLLPETATRRDIGDPVTIRTVAEAVGDVFTLDLLYGLTRADAAATGPAAWTSWKAGLVASLVDRVRSTLDTGAVPAPPEPDPALVVGALPTVHVSADRVAVAAADRRGLLAAVAGCVDRHRLDIVGADVATVEGRALVQCMVAPRYGTPADPGPLVADLRRAVRGLADPPPAPAGARGSDRGRGRGRDQDQDQDQDRDSDRDSDRGRGRDRDRDRRVSGARGDGVAGRPGRVVWHLDAATDAAVVELRTTDAPGLLARVTGALASAGADVRAARIATLGGEVVDTFYLTGSWSDPAARAGITGAVLDTLVR